MTSSVESSVEALVKRPYEFDFVQAVQMLQAVAPGESESVGYDYSPHQEIVRFGVSASLRNSATQITSVKEDEFGYKLTVPFIGMIGVNGVLPRHYSQAVIQRTKRRDFAMLDFFDLFHHRIISMFFRASVKYRLPYQYEYHVGKTKAKREKGTAKKSEGHDRITEALFCLVGLGGPRLKNRQSIPDQTLLRYGGHFSDAKPTAVSLERMTEDFLGLPAKVKQFQFEWLYIEPDEQTCLSASSQSSLGSSVVIGSRVRSYQSRFRISVGPVSWSQFCDLLPDSRRAVALSELVRTYVGVSLDFDLQVNVNGKQIPPAKLDSQTPPMLGRTSWIFSEPMDRVVEDAVFDISCFN